MVLLGSGDWVYEVSGEDWGNLPEGATYKEATAVDVDANDNVYVFNRGTHPMIVFDTEGNVQRTWGHGVFNNPHGVTVGPDGNLWCVDNGDHTVRQMSPDGKVLMTIGTPGAAVAADEREAVQRALSCGFRPAQRRFLCGRRLYQRGGA